MTSRIARTLLAGSAAIAFAASAVAQDGAIAADANPESPNDIRTAEEIVVQGQIGYRNRTDTAEPVLVYDSDFFQRFEPLTAGDALKRVPGVTFLSDVIESDGARLRGLDPGYTQILINGDKVPGSNVDRSFFMDRIPAELIERVEIVRSSSARRTGDAVAGSLNIVLRDGYELDGAYVKAGGLRFSDDKIKPVLGALWGGQVGPGRLLIGANLQGRYNPKRKKSLRYGDSPENDPDYATEEFDNREDQDDIRNGTDYAFNASYTVKLPDTEFELGGYVVRTDRKESERSFEYDDPEAESGPVPAGNLLTDNININDIDQLNFGLNGKAKQRWSAGETTLKLGYAKFRDDQFETEYEIDFDRGTPRFTGDTSDRETIDSEFSANLEHAFTLAPDIKLAIGGFFQDKDRKFTGASIRDRFNLTAADRVYDQFNDDPTRFARDVTLEYGTSVVEEQRRDAYALVEGKQGGISWEIGGRYESTQVDIGSGPGKIEYDYSHFLPSASAKIELTERDRLLLSVARTVRRPRFDYVQDVLLEAELGDNDLLGNPDLKPETAWGVDAGYERRIGSTGIAGVNLFYRKISDLVEIANTGLEGSEGEGTFILQPRNTGTGKVWGIEFDMSVSLGAVGLKDTGLFGNLALIKSRVRDEFGTRRFNGQPKFVYNIGFIQNLPSLAAAFGANYRKQGTAYDRNVGEEIRTTYGADLEVFVEKRFGKRLTIRAVGSNLLDGAKKERFNKFTTIDDQIDRSFDEYELESETAGRVFQLIARAAF